MFTAISKFFYKISPSVIQNSFNSDGFILYIKNVQWITVWKVLTTVFSLITTMIVARLLGPELFGTLSYVLSLTGLFAVVGSLGIGYIVYSDMVKHKELREEILGSSIALTLITGALAYCLVIIFILFSNENAYIESLILLTALSFFTTPFSYLHIDFLKDKDGKFVAITQIATTVTSGILKILSVFVYSSLYMFIIVIVFENIFSGIIYLYQIKYIKKRTVNFVASRERVKKYFFTAIPLTALVAFNEIYYRIDQILLKHMTDVSSVGLYATEVRLTEIWYIVPNILIASLFPALAHTSFKKEGNEYGKRFKIFMVTLLSISLLIVMCTVFFGKYFIQFVYGQAFIEATTVLSVYIISLPGSFISMLIMQDMFLAEKKWKMVLFSFCTAA